MVYYYPIFLDLRSKPVVVIGGGKVALRKVKSLLEAQAQVTVISPEILDDLRALPIQVLERSYQDGDLRGHALVFATTNKRAVNALIAHDAAALGIPSNIADAPEECGFIVPARLTEGDLQIAVSTGGRDPQRAVAVRDRLQQILKQV